MRRSYLEITYRKGRIIAAYYYLPRNNGDKSARTQRVSDGLLVDFTADGRAIGVEISSPSNFSLASLNKALAELGHDPVRPEDLGPLVAA